MTVRIWILVLSLCIPALLLGIWRLRWMVRRGHKAKAGVLLGFSLIFLFVGVTRRYQAISAAHQEDPQAFRYSANPLIRSLFTPDAAPTAITDDTTGQEAFTYFRNDGAARLTALERPASREWQATFAVSAGEAQNSRLHGYFEKELKDDAQVLPMTRVYRSFGGGLRVEDSQTGVTLFRFWEESQVRPVEGVKTPTGAGTYEWKVKFAPSVGLLSQQAKEQQ
jgi:hypothetical protein